jgi:hypothetical protein
MHPFPNHVLDVLQAIRVELEGYSIEEGYPHDLCGLCAISASMVHEELKALGINTEIYLNRIDSYSYAHAYNMYEDWVIDLTATQFQDLDDTVFIKHRSELKDDAHYFGIQTEWFDSNADFVNELNHIGWPEPEYLGQTVGEKIGVNYNYLGLIFTNMIDPNKPLELNKNLKTFSFGGENSNEN